MKNKNAIIDSKQNMYNISYSRYLNENSLHQSYKPYSNLNFKTIAIVAHFDLSLIMFATSCFDLIVYV